MVPLRPQKQPLRRPPQTVLLKQPQVRLNPQRRPVRPQRGRQIRLLKRKQLRRSPSSRKLLLRLFQKLRRNFQVSR
jgi:hypothetical protein